MNIGKATHDGPVPDLYMAGELRIVGENGVVADDAVVGDVHVGHDPVVVAHARYAGIAGRADVERAELTNGVAVTNDQLAGLARVLLVLRNRAQRVELKNAVVIANRGVTFDHAMRAHSRACTHANVGSNDGVRPHLHRAVELGLGVHNGGGVNEAHRLLFGLVGV